DHHPCRLHALVAVRAGDNAGDTTGTARLVDRCAPDGDSGLVVTPGGNRLLEEHPVEIAPHDRAPRLPARGAPVDDVAALAGDPHAVDTQRARVEVAGNTETPQPLERPGIDRVTAQLVAREHGAIEQQHARPRAREDKAGDRASRAGTNNYN